MTSDDAPAESSLYVGFAQRRGEEALPVGLLKLARRRVMESGEFAYGRRYLAAPAPLPLNPEHLPLRDATFVLPAQRVRDGGALPLTLRDALPDSWGRKVLEVQQGRPLSDVEALLLTNEDRVGAMVFAAELPIRSEPPATEALSLDDLPQSISEVYLTPDQNGAIQDVLTAYWNTAMPVEKAQKNFAAALKQ